MSGMNGRFHNLDPHETETVEEASSVAVSFGVALLVACATLLHHFFIAAWLTALLLFWLFLKGASVVSDHHDVEGPMAAASPKAGSSMSEAFIECDGALAANLELSGRLSGL